MIDLTNTTFIIPVRIDSADREFNFNYVIQYLCTHLSTNIIIKESDERCHTSKLLENIKCNDSKITHHFERSDNKVFYRTRLLNEMLTTVKTPVTVNYDIDILLEPDTYRAAQKYIISNNADLVYPYYNGFSQRMIYDKKSLIASKHLFSVIAQSHNSICGHCQFFKTESYIKGGMENENFISWGPEDSERMNRFIKLGYQVLWLNNYIWHIEHQRGINSEEKNPHFWDNKRLFDQLSLLNATELKDYYNNVEYLKKYV